MSVFFCIAAVCLLNFRFLEDLDEGVFIQQTVETVLQNEDGKQLLVSNILFVWLRFSSMFCYIALRPEALQLV